MLKPLLISVIATLALSSHSQVRINEIMQSNVTTLMVDSQFPASWVELSNESASSVNLSGWSLGVDGESPYRLPEGTVIPARGYLTVYCDKAGKGLHTSFRLATGAGYVALFDTSGDAVDVMSHRKMAAVDVSFGRAADGSLQHFISPTPGAANAAPVENIEPLPSPVFNHSGGVYNSEFNVIVSYERSAALPSDVRLCVTTDGREPTAADAVESPFTIAARGNLALRARLISDRRIASPTVCHTYLISERDIEFPIVCLTTDPALLYDAEIGMLAGSEDEQTPNYRQKWRRPVNIEMFDGKDHTEVINQLGETEPQGWSSLQFPQKSLKLYSNTRFGTKRFMHTIWPDQKPQMNIVRSFTLRNGGNTFSSDHLRDSFLNLLFGLNTGGTVDYQAFRPAVAFINGRPYGYIDLRERSNDHFIEANYPDISRFTVVSDWRETAEGGNDSERKSLIELYNSPETTFAQLADVIDMESFVTSMLADAFSFNVDTPDVNKVMWKPEGGRWRWMLKDMDCTLYNSLVDNDYIHYLSMGEDPDYQSWFKNTVTGTALYRKCLELPEFTDMMIDRFVAFNGDFLHPDNTTSMLCDMKDLIADEYANLARLYGFFNNIDASVESHCEFLEKRGEYMMSHLQKRYALGETLPLTIDNSSGALSLNGHKLSLDNFDGICFTDRPLSLDSSHKGKWTVTLTDTDGKYSTITSRDQTFSVTPGSDISSCHISFESESGIETPEMLPDDFPGDPVWHTLQGVRLGDRPSIPGIYIETRGNRSRKIIVR